MAGARVAAPMPAPRPPPRRGRVVVIAAGNRLRGDDGAGPAALDRLTAEWGDRLPAAVEHVEVSGGAAELMAAWEGAETVYVVDCAAGAGPPGTVHRFDATAVALPAALGAASSHGLGLATAVEMARALGRLPAKLVVYAVSGERFGPAAGVSPAVARGAAQVAAAIRRELAGT